MLEAGVYNDLSAPGIGFKKTLRSVRISPGCFATFYEDTNYKGSQCNVTTDQSAISNSDGLASSLTILCDNL